MSKDFQFIKFKPGQSLIGTEPFDLAEGLSWAGWIRLSPRRKNAQTIFNAGTVDDPGAFSLCLDARNDLCLRVGNRSISIPVKHAHPYYGKWAMLAAYALLQEDELTLELELNNETHAISAGTYEGPFLLPKQITGGGEAEFGLAEVIVIGRVLTREERERVIARFRADCG